MNRRGKYSLSVRPAALGRQQTKGIIKTKNMNLNIFLCIQYQFTLFPLLQVRVVRSWSRGSVALLRVLSADQAPFTQVGLVFSFQQGTSYLFECAAELPQPNHMSRLSQHPWPHYLTEIIKVHMAMPCRKTGDAVTHSHMPCRKTGDAVTHSHMHRLSTRDTYPPWSVTDRHDWTLAYKEVLYCKYQLNK